MRGYLFDMNLFFQRLLSRFLHENLTEARIGDEFTIRGLYSHAPGANPRRRRTPAPRPDIALYRGNNLTAFLDAKYRDLWDRPLPHDWLYQMTIYSLASPSKLSVLLYASMSTRGLDECVLIHHPAYKNAAALGSVIFRPVPLINLAELLSPGGSSTQARARRDLAERLIAA